MGANASMPAGPFADSKHAETINHSSASTAHHNAPLLGSLNEVPINSIGLMFSKDKKLKKLKQKLKTKLKTPLKGTNHAQVFRDFSNLISIRDLAQLYEEYKATFFLKELSHHAESARPIASSIRNDLSELYDFKHNPDITLVYKGVDFPVHKAIVCVRCPYFRELLGKKLPGSTVPVNLEINGLRVELFNDLLKYLYTGELAGSYDPRSNSSSYRALIRISQECGVPNSLSHDLKYLLDTGIYSDASLCFQTGENNLSTTTETVEPASNKPLHQCTCFEQSEFSCHQAILVARSPFFRNVITRQQRRNATLKQDSLNQRAKIVLDESIIPRRFARILLHVMYRDSDDLMNLVQSCICKCSNTSNASSMSNIFLVKQIMELYEIARFLEIDYLVQSCEDLLIELLVIDTVIPILKWSEQSHGSPWVKRQCLCFLKEEFSSVIASPALLYQLEFSHLMEALRSDFLEASELEILKAIFKWGEHQLQQLKQDESEPNILVSHSLTRRKKKVDDQVDDGKLQEFISELIDLVRIGHILPIDSEYLTNIAKRGFITTLPPYMIGDDNSLPINRGLTAWFRNRAKGDFVRPRYFTPYFEECKLILEERLGYSIPSDDNFDSLMTILNKKCNMQIPDALYMVDSNNFNNGGCSVVSDGDLISPVENFHFCFTSSSSSSVICYEDIDKPRPNLPILEERILLMMRQREQELKTSPFCARALKVAHNRCQALRLIQLRVVREFGLPDIACEVLHLRNFASIQQQTARDLDDNATQVSFDRNDPEMNLPPPPPRPASGFLPSNNQACDPFSYHSELKLERSSSRYELESQFSSTDSHLTISEKMPDIAITTRGLANLDLGQIS